MFRDETATSLPLKLVNCIDLCDSLVILKRDDPSTSKLRKIPKIQLRAQERVVEVPVTLKVEQPVEVPQVLVAEQVKQVPSTEVQYVDREVPNITYQALEQIVEVPQVIKEERLVEVPQVQVAEFIKQVPKQQVQEIPKHIPKVEMRCVEKIQNVPVKLMQEVAVEVPQVLRHEVISQGSQQTEQRVVQAAEEYERFVNRDEVVVGEQESQPLGLVCYALLHPLCNLPAGVYSECNSMTLRANFSIL